MPCIVHRVQCTVFSAQCTEHSVPCIVHSAQSTLYRVYPEGALPINGLMGMCRWMGSHFHDRTDYNWAAFSSTFYRVTRMGSHFSGILRVRKFWQVVIYKRKDSPKVHSAQSTVYCV